jgi:hypothetical protein
MTSERQIRANRLNSACSTGPKTIAGKKRSSQNAMIHGLTSRTVVAVFEDDLEFQEFASQISGTFSQPSPIERELINRLIGLLWRLRRAQAVEAGLMSIQGKLQRDIRVATVSDPKIHDDKVLSSLGLECRTEQRAPSLAEQRAESKARAFLRLCNLNGEAFDRLGRYETSLWRQAVQTLFLLENTANSFRGSFLKQP